MPTTHRSGKGYLAWGQPVLRLRGRYSEQPPGRLQSAYRNTAGSCFSIGSGSGIRTRSSQFDLQAFKPLDVRLRDEPKATTVPLQELSQTGMRVPPSVCTNFLCSSADLIACTHKLCVPNLNS